MRRLSLMLVGLALILSALACNAPSPSPTPEVTPYIPETATPSPIPATPTPPLPAPTDTPEAAVCPSPASPSPPAQPDTFDTYPTVVQDYLSAGGSVAGLESFLTDWEVLESIAAADLTGDGVEEVVLTMRDPTSPFMPPAGGLFIYGCRAGGYELLARRVSEDLGVSLLEVTDATGEGVPEVVYVRESCGAHTCYRSLKILAWDGGSFRELISGSLDMPYPTYTIEPGRIEADSGGIGSVGAEPQRDYAEIWTWTGEVFTRTEQIWASPVYRYHALLDGERALREGDTTAALETYRRVIEDDGLQEWGAEGGMVEPAEERATLKAFARWRILLTHLQVGDEAQAQAAYQQLQENYPPGAAGHEVAALAEDFWSAYQASGEIGQGCDRALDGGSGSAILDFFNTNYGYANPQWEADDLCPVGTF